MPTKLYLSPSILYLKLWNLNGFNIASIKQHSSSCLVDKLCLNIIAHNCLKLIRSIFKSNLPLWNCLCLDFVWMNLLHLQYLLYACLVIFNIHNADRKINLNTVLPKSNNPLLLQVWWLAKSLEHGAGTAQDDLIIISRNNVLKQFSAFWMWTGTSLIYF